MRLASFSLFAMSMAVVSLAQEAVPAPTAALAPKHQMETFVFTESYRTLKNASVRDEQTHVVWAQRDLGSGPLSSRFGAFAWGQISKSYRQAYAGPYVRPASWLSVGVGAGVEQAKSKARLGSFAYAAKGSYNAFAIYENGGSDYWYLLLTDRRIGKRLSVGSHSQAYVGHGPRFEWKIGTFGNWTASVRPAVLWKDLKGAAPDNAIVGLRFTYFRAE